MESQGNGIREPLRSSRWSPKPEQIMILESIFNSGMVNPPRHEATRIRNLLESFGPVADANVFYWFQNRRSRYRRLQRQNLFGSNSTTAPSIDSDVITVFINGVEREIRRGCVHVRSVLGGDFTIYDSSGVAVEVNERGYLLRSLQEGQTYSLVPRNS